MLFGRRGAGKYAAIGAALILLTLGASHFFRAGGSLDFITLPYGGYTLDVSSWSGVDTRALQLLAGEEAAVEIALEAGDVGLSISGADGQAVYTGNRLAACTFSVRVPAAGQYTVRVKGRRAAGRVTLRRGP